VNVAELVHKVEEPARARPARARIITALGPLTVLAGVAWALAQPYRLTILHPHGQGFWWLLSEPPVYVVAVGFLFRFLIAPGLLDDLEDEP
jgi:hypothetical protein